MKLIMISVFCSIYFFGMSQLSGDLAQDGRKLLTETSFVIEGNHNGKLVFDLAVNPEGEITSIKYNHSESSVSSTPSQMKARKYVNDFKFEKGTHFPKFHQTKVTLTMVKPK